MLSHFLSLDLTVFRWEKNFYSQVQWFYQIGLGLLSTFSKGLIFSGVLLLIGYFVFSILPKETSQTSNPVLLKTETTLSKSNEITTPASQKTDVSHEVITDIDLTETVMEKKQQNDLTFIQWNKHTHNINTTVVYVTLVKQYQTIIWQFVLRIQLSLQLSC